MSPRRFDVICLGYSSLDYLAMVPGLPEIDTKLEMQDFCIQGGGPAATAAVTASRLGASTAFVGQIGDDDFARQMLEEFAREGVDTSSVVRAQGARSQFAFILVDASTGRRTILWTRSRVPPLDTAALDEELIRSCRVLHLDRHETGAAVQAAHWARSSGVVVSMDAGTYSPEVEPLLPLVDVLITSRVFAASATGEDDPARGAQALRRGRRICGVTAGDGGSWFATAEGCFGAPAFAVPVVDTTGAGDVFHGAFVFGLARQWDARRCATVASAAAALKCMRLGGRAGIPVLSAAEELVANAADAGWRIEEL